jgi:hypothetical protein
MADGFDPVAYAHANPINLSDPYGPTGVGAACAAGAGVKIAAGGLRSLTKLKHILRSIEALVEKAKVAESPRRRVP